MRTMAVERQNIRQVCTQVVEDRNLSSSAFVHHRHLNAVTETALAVHQYRIHILDTSVRAYAVVGDIIVYIIKVAVVAYAAVMQHGVENTGMHLDASGQVYLTLEYTHLNRAGEMYILHPARVKTFCHFH